MSTIQAKFYPERLLLERATATKDRHFAGKDCAEVQSLGGIDNPQGGVKLYSWLCLSRTEESAVLNVHIEYDGYPRVYSERITCTDYPQIAKQGFVCNE